MPAQVLPEAIPESVAQMVDRWTKAEQLMFDTLLGVFEMLVHRDVLSWDDYRYLISARSALDRPTHHQRIGRRLAEATGDGLLAQNQFDPRHPNFPKAAEIAPHIRDDTFWGKAPGQLRSMRGLLYGIIGCWRQTSPN